jgi:hypothetical protein
MSFGYQIVCTLSAVIAGLMTYLALSGGVAYLSSAACAGIAVWFGASAICVAAVGVGYYLKPPSN